MPERVTSTSGYSVLELVLVLALISVVASMAAGSLEGLRADARALGAARFVAARLGDERLSAIRRGRIAGLYFRGEGRDTSMQAVADGNFNGLRSIEVASGIDRAAEAPVMIGDLFPGVAFEVARSVPPIDQEGARLDEGSDPIRIGPTSFLSFSPAGTATSGTLYLATRDRRQLAVRVFGATGRIRVFEFRPVQGTWEPR